MTSVNFEFLRQHWPELSGLGAFAEAYTYTDPTSAMFNLRLFAENLVKDIYRDLKLPKPIRATQIDLLEDGTFCSITPKVVRDKLHAIRVEGNKAAHGEGATTDKALWLLREAFDLGRWLAVNFKKADIKSLPQFAFTEYLESEPIRIVNSRASGESTERIFIATYPAMLKVYQSFDVGFFDLIIADESHRSIYNIYGDLFHYFDSLQIGLTATPVNFVTRSTFGLFNCEGQLPTFNYDLEQAVTSEPPYLTPFEVFEHTTQFLRDGIRLDGLTPDQINELEVQGEDPNLYDFSSEQIDQAIYNRDTNRSIIRNLMENGVRDGAGQTIGKTIIFARNHVHAMLMSSLFDEMYPQYGGKFCRVIDNYDPRAEQLIDDLKNNSNELTVAISVDMLDTGIDVPEIVNLVFAKPVRSPVKFWQMVGRGTRLCRDLFGPGLDKKIFRIFDHWGNFQRFEDGYQPAEPQQSKSLLQLLFEQRLALAERALRQSDIPSFDMMIGLIAADIQALPEESIAVRERWREKRSVGAMENLRRFDPNTVTVLRNTLAPLMQWRNIRGATEAHGFDLLVCRMQTATLMASADVADLRIEFMERLDRLQMHLNPVRERAEVIKRVAFLLEQVFLPKGHTKGLFCPYFRFPSWESCGGGLFRGG